MENQNNRVPLNMESEVMTTLRTQIDNLLKKTLMRMQFTRCTQAKLAVAMEIELVEAAIPDGSGGYREGVVPVLKHKVKTRIQMDDEEKGSNPTGYELVWDSALEEYYLKKIPSNQTSLFEDADMDADAILDDVPELPFEDLEEEPE